MIKITNDELTRLMGGSTVELDLSQTPTIILIAGLQGSGKTTFSGKLARLIKSKGKRPLLVAGDVYRPAAIDQLKIVGEQVGVPVHTDYESKDPVGIAQAAIRSEEQTSELQSLMRISYAVFC